MYKNVLVVGGKGYIGRHLQKAFPTFIYTNSHDFNLNHPKEIERFCHTLDPIDLCIILSANISYHPNLTIENEPFKTNVSGLNHLLKVLQTSHPNTKIIYFSSMTVYDSSNPSPVDENANRRPLHPYGLSKVFAEELIKFYRLESIIIRIPGVYGGDRESGFIYNTIQKLKDNQEIIFDTTDLGYWEGIYIDDLIAIFGKFLRKYTFNTRCDVFNLSYGEKTDFIDTIHFLKSQLHSTSQIHVEKHYNDLFLSNQKLVSYVDDTYNYFNSLIKYLTYLNQKEASCSKSL